MALANASEVREAPRRDAEHDRPAEGVVGMHGDIAEAYGLTKPQSQVRVEKPGLLQALEGLPHRVGRRQIERRQDVGGQIDEICTPR